MAPRTDPSRTRSLTTRLVTAGLDPERARSQLAAAGMLPDPDGAGGGFVEGGPLDRLLALVSEAAAPQDALAVVTALASAHPHTYAAVADEREWLSRLVMLAGISRPLGDLLARFPDAVSALRTLDALDAASTARRVEVAVASSTVQDEQAAAIAEIRRRATADIAARDLGGVAPVEEIAAELAGLAEAVLTGTLAAVHHQIGGATPAARLGVVGMGKLGGFELNYVSDVDVVFVHAPTGTGHDAAERALREARQVLERLLALLNASTTMGRAYEIDPTLRPEGRSGPLSRTVDSFVAYWERWAKTWEFQALLKARPVAGDRELVSQLLQRAEPFVYPDELDPAVVAEIREMKGRVEAKPEVVRHRERQVKLGPGGLRDIEFAVQLLQLVHGRADRSLRVTGTLPALAALARGGYVADDDAATFANAYRELRAVEHRLQLAHERRTHIVPDDPERQEWLARSLGYRSRQEEPARSEFLAHLARVQADVRQLHAKLFYRPLLEAHAQVSARDGGLTLPHEVRAMGESGAIERLAALGFRDPAGALRDLRTLTAGVSRRARTLRAVLPAMLGVLQDSPDPDGGLRAFRTLVEAQGRTSGLLAQLRDHPPAANLLARVLGTSEVAGELLVAQPQGIEWFHGEGPREGRTRDELVRMALARLNWQDRTAALRRFKRHELLRVVIRDVAGTAQVGMVGEELAALGEACLEGALLAELRAQSDEIGAGGPDELPMRIAIVGMGKLGGRELHYASDLDVLFVHEAVDGAEEAAASRLALRVAERVMASLGRITAEGAAFEVDADLRPEGRSGPLSRSLDSYRAYYDRWSHPWEHQALLRSRPVAGDPGLGRRFVELARPLAYPEAFTERDAQRMRKMKARIERERGRGLTAQVARRPTPALGSPRTPSTRLERHLKLGAGGLTDVEWTVQLLQQRHGHAHPMVRSTSTMAALDALQDAGLLEHREAAWLREGYRFLSQVRNRLYLMRQRDVDVLPPSPELLDRLAGSLGYGRSGRSGTAGAGGRQAFEDEHLRHTRRVRRVAELLFYEVEPSVTLFED